MEAVDVTKLLSTVFLTLLAFASFAQSETSAYRMAPNKDDIEIDFLGNYYGQDGNSGAPQGGLGTEQLSNIAGIIVVKVPLDSNSALNATVGADLYSSASTDRIDYQLSTASSSDLRTYGNIGYTQRDLKNGRTYGAKLGVSTEYDYFSLNGGLTFTQEWAQGQHEVSLGLQAFNDRWDIIYPLELRTPSANFSRITNANRQSYGFSASYATIVNRRLQVAITTEVVAMQGLLSTPFHRIYFRNGRTDQEQADFRDLFLTTSLQDRSAISALRADDIEKLPDSRIKFPISIRANIKANDALTVRTFARYYTDNWGVQGTSAELELAYQLGEDWVVTPFGRYYSQKASDYYAGFAEHLSSEEFYTSDIDLAEFTTQTVGLNVRYAPVFGLGRAIFANRGLEWKQLTLRGSYFTRSIPFDAFSVSMATSFAIRKLK